MLGRGDDFIREQKDFLNGILREDSKVLENAEIEKLDLNYYDGLLPHPLVYLMYNNCSIESFKKLVEMGADINLQCVLTGTFPIHHASYLGRVDIVRYLIEKNSSINAEDHIGKRTALHYAVEKGFVEVAKILSEYGADIDSSDMDGFTPLQIAVELGINEMVLALLPFTKNINIKNRYTGQTALHFACKSGNGEMITALIRKGANPYIKDVYGISSFDLIRGSDNFVLVRIMENFIGNFLKDGDFRNGSNFEDGEPKAV